MNRSDVPAALDGILELYCHETGRPVDFVSTTDLIRWAAVIKRRQGRERMIQGRPMSDFLSPIPTQYTDHDTVLGYLARHQPYVLDLMDPKAEVTARDGFWLTHRCREQGFRPLKVPAPLFLAEQGIEHVNAYPVTLLRQRFDE